MDNSIEEFTYHRVPVLLGELINEIIILSISLKSVNEKKANVKYEHDLLENELVKFCSKRY